MANKWSFFLLINHHYLPFQNTVVPWLEQLVLANTHMMHVLSYLQYYLFLS